MLKSADARTKAIAGFSICVPFQCHSPHVILFLFHLIISDEYSQHLHLCSLKKFTRKLQNRGRVRIIFVVKKIGHFRKSTWTTTPEPKQDDYCDILNCSFDGTSESHINNKALNILRYGMQLSQPWSHKKAMDIEKPRVRVSINRNYWYPGNSNKWTVCFCYIGCWRHCHFGVTKVQRNQKSQRATLPVFQTISDDNDSIMFRYQFFNSFEFTDQCFLGSRYTNPMRTVSSFVQCPSILRSVTSKNAYRWNTVHIQLPPGTTHVSFRR